MTHVSFEIANKQINWRPSRSPVNKIIDTLILWYQGKAGCQFTDLMYVVRLV